MHMPSNEKLSYNLRENSSGLSFFVTQVFWLLFIIIIIFFFWKIVTGFILPCRLIIGILIPC